ncbi:MAG: flagellar hook-length control protein FliK [Selenomonadaceae bacterium]|nr:flagellar hook-length control protein FliK [Selenomonadaceae bacterium]
MSSNVNLFSLGANVAVRASVKASVKTGSQVSDFSRTLDQAQQARSRDTVKSDKGYRNDSLKDNAKAEKPEAAGAIGSQAEKPEAAAGKAEAEKPENAGKAGKAGKAEEAGDASDVQAKGEADGKQPAVAEADAKLPGNNPASAMAAAVAEGVIATQGQQPLAELNTYFKGDARLQGSLTGSGELQAGVQQPGQRMQTLQTLQQSGGQQQPLDSLQPVNGMEELAPVGAGTQPADKQVPNQPGHLMANEAVADETASAPIRQATNQAANHMEHAAPSVETTPAPIRQATNQAVNHMANAVPSVESAPAPIRQATNQAANFVENAAPSVEAAPAPIRQAANQAAHLVENAAPSVESAPAPIRQATNQAANLVENVTPSVEAAPAPIRQATNQAANLVENAAPSVETAPAPTRRQADVMDNPVARTGRYVPNSIEALLGSRVMRQNVQQAANTSQVQGRTDNGQQLLNMLPGQRIFTTVQESGAVSEAVGTAADASQLSDLAGQMGPVQGEGSQRGFAQQQNQQGGMTNSQGQQQGTQLPGEAAFDVVVPDSNAARSERAGQGQQDSMAGFQQMLGSGQNVGNADAANAPQQTAQSQQAQSTYNVPQQIVEQAKLLQNGRSSEMIIKLNPEHLGELSLKVSVNGNGGVTATFHTDNAHVRAILETNMLQLKQQLNEQGIKVDSIEVQTGLPDGQLPDGQAQQGFYQQEQGQQVRSQQIDLKDFEETSEALAAEPENNATTDIHDSEGNVISSGVDYSV